MPVAECNLQQFLNKPSLTPNELSLIRQFFGCITSGVAYIHRNTCRHKDITPRNILVNRGVVYITDFGLAYDWTDESKSKTYGKPGAMSLNYAAPEVFTEGNHGSATDMWSLGCTFLDMVVIISSSRWMKETCAYFSC